VSPLAEYILSQSSSTFCTLIQQRLLWRVPFLLSSIFPCLSIFRHHCTDSTTFWRPPLSRGGGPSFFDKLFRHGLFRFRIQCPSLNAMPRPPHSALDSNSRIGICRHRRGVSFEFPSAYGAFATRLTGSALCLFFSPLSFACAKTPPRSCKAVF